MSAKLDMAWSQHGEIAVLTLDKEAVKVLILVGEEEEHLVYDEQSLS